LKNIRTAYEKFKKTYENLKRSVWKHAEVYKELNVIISVIKSRKKRVGSMIASEISRKNPEKIVFLIEKRKDFYKIHGRYQRGKIHIGKLLKSVCLEGGGHREAAGGFIKPNTIKEFKKRLIEELCCKIRRNRPFLIKSR
jgi:oligoribonuclease NrnB/cAMP/cGMP phosphodiesterase (DHH superfamily)